MCELVTIGWLTTDDIVLDDKSFRPGVLGGGALYSAVGAQIWNDSVGVCAPTGEDVIEPTRRQIAARGLDVEGVSAIPGAGLQLWLLHESETFKRQVPKLHSATADAMDAGRKALPESYRAAKGFHVAPQTPQGGAALVRSLTRGQGRTVVTIDILPDEMIDRRLYADLEIFRGVSALLPSEAEIARIWDPPDLRAWLRTSAQRLQCHVVAKLGVRGSLSYDPYAREFVHTPAYPVRVVDTTGAGDGYCGGFLAGLAAGRSVADSAAMGAVSASHIIEACGALQTAKPKSGDRDERLRDVLARTVVEEAA